MDLESEDNALIAGGASVTAMEEDAAIRSSIPNDQQRAEETDDTPALFVTTMPQDIWANPSLGALAALIDESNEEQMNGANGAYTRSERPLRRLCAKSTFPATAVVQVMSDMIR